jgi:primosomal protein N' (replication factor Y)
MAALLNADSYLYAPDFRAGERAFREFIYTAGKVRPGGEMVLVTRNPRAPLLEHLRRYDFRRFYEGELKARQALGYPPFGRMVLLQVDSEFAPDVGRHGDVEVLGPVRSRGRRGKPVWKALFKSADRRALRSAVRGAIAKLGGLRFSVDVDPVAM